MFACYFLDTNPSSFPSTTLSLILIRKHYTPLPSMNFQNSQFLISKIRRLMLWRNQVILSKTSPFTSFSDSFSVSWCIIQRFYQNYSNLVCDVIFPLEFFAQRFYSFLFASSILLIKNSWITGCEAFSLKCY